MMSAVRDDLWGWFHQPSGAFLSAGFAEKFYGARIYRQGQRPEGLVPLFELARQNGRILVERGDDGKEMVVDV